MSGVKRDLCRLSMEPQRSMPFRHSGPASPFFEIAGGHLTARSNGGTEGEGVKDPPLVGAERRGRGTGGGTALTPVFGPAGPRQRPQAVSLTQPAGLTTGPCGLIPTDPYVLHKDV